MKNKKNKREIRSYIGLYLKELREQNNQTMEFMAKELGVSSTFLAHVEYGLKNIPETMMRKIQKNYKLSNDEYGRMEQAAEKSKIKVTIDLRYSSNLKRELMITFSKRFDEIDENTCKKILNIINEIHPDNNY